MIQGREPGLQLDAWLEGLILTKRPIYKRLFYIVKEQHIKKKYLLPWNILNMQKINADGIIEPFYMSVLFSISDANPRSCIPII